MVKSHNGCKRTKKGRFSTLGVIKNGLQIDKENIYFDHQDSFEESVKAVGFLSPESSINTYIRRWSTLDLTKCSYVMEPILPGDPVLETAALVTPFISSLIARPRNSLSIGTFIHNAPAAKAGVVG